MGSTTKPAMGKKAEAAKKAASAITKGTKTTQKEIRTKIRFYLPKTLKLERRPKYTRKYRPRSNGLDRYQILKYPLTTESAMKKIEENNTLVFIVDVPRARYRLRRRSRRCTTLTPRRSTLSSGLMVRRRHMFASPRTMTPWMFQQDWYHLNSLAIHMLPSYL